MSRVSGAISVAAFAVLALGAMRAEGLTIENGDVVGVFVKNGFEKVVNLGPFPFGTDMVEIPLSAELDIPEFGGTVDGAKFVALAVSDPEATINFGLGVVPWENVTFTTNAIDPMPSDSNIAGAMASTDQSLTSWFGLLRQLGAGDSELIDSAETFSYENKLGKGSDGIANNFLFSTADDVVGDLVIDIYEAYRGYEGFPGGPPTSVVMLGTIEVDAATATVVLAPEPAATAMLGICAAGLLTSVRCRRRAAR